MKTNRVHRDSTAARVPRQSKVQGRKRVRTVSVWMPVQLAEAVRKAARAAGIRPGQFVRLAVLEGISKIESGKLQQRKGGAL